MKPRPGATDGATTDQRNMHKPLQSLADIRTGHTFRGKIPEDPQGDVRFVQIKEVKGQTSLRSENLPRMQWQGCGEPPLLAEGDILIPARGEHYDAAVIDGVLPSIATSQLFVLHPCSKNISSEYLGWYLNQPAARNYFRANSTGTSIPMLNKTTLGALLVPVPPLEIQRKIVALQRLWEQEKRLTEQLLQNRETMLAGVFQHLLEH